MHGTQGGVAPNQINIAKACDVLIRGMAMVGTIALVDEATGFQYERDRSELHRILETFIAKELLPWAQRFPDEFYRQMFRLRGWAFSPLLPAQGPRYAGKLTNELVYERLPDGVLAELRVRNPVNDDTGRRKYRHHHSRFQRRRSRRTTTSHRQNKPLGRLAPEGFLESVPRSER